MNWLKQWVLKKAIQRALKEVKKMNFLKGYKTLIAGVLAIVTGILQMMGVAPDFLATGTVTGWELILSGLGLLGIGGKLAAIEGK